MLSFSRIEMKLDRMESRYTLPDVEGNETNMFNICSPRDVFELEEKLNDHHYRKQFVSFFFCLYCWLLIAYILNFRNLHWQSSAE